MSPADSPSRPLQSPARDRSVLELRLTSVDALRGLVMILMVLDHVRDFFHQGAMSFSPEDLARTTPALFLTRWITHFCAPVFFFAAGIGAWLWKRKRGRSSGDLTRFLLTRGLWLIVLEFTVVRFAFFFSLTTGPVLLIVLWALGASMIALAALHHIPFRFLAVVSVAVIALHNMADSVTAADLGSLAPLWLLLHQQGAFPIASVILVVAYPLLPWIAVMSAGFCFGRVLEWESARRRRFLLMTGLGATMMFIVLRALNVYGDPSPWVSGEGVNAILSFLRTTKYPPSLLFLLMTLGPALALLAWLEHLRLAASNPLVVIGRVPLFFFIAHLLVAHLLWFPLAWLVYGDTAFLWNPLPSVGGSRDLYPPGFGFSLPAVYAIWVGVVLLLYPLCAWFAALKQRRTSWWLTYL